MQKLIKAVIQCFLCITIVIASIAPTGLNSVYAQHISEALWIEEDFEGRQLDGNIFSIRSNYNTGLASSDYSFLTDDGTDYYLEISNKNLQAGGLEIDIGALTQNMNAYDGEGLSISFKIRALPGQSFRAAVLVYGNGDGYLHNNYMSWEVTDSEWVTIEYDAFGARYCFRRLDTSNTVWMNGADTGKIIFLTTSGLQSSTGTPLNCADMKGYQIDDICIYAPYEGSYEVSQFVSLVGDLPDELSVTAQDGPAIRRAFEAYYSIPADILSADSRRMETAYERLMRIFSAYEECTELKPSEPVQILGAQLVRYDDGADSLPALRFGSRWNYSVKRDVGEGYRRVEYDGLEYTVLEAGTLIIKESLLSGQLTAATAGVQLVPSGNTYKITAEAEWFVAEISDISAADASVSYAAKAYLKCEDNEGSVRYIYSGETLIRSLQTASELSELPDFDAGDTADLTALPAAIIGDLSFLAGDYYKSSMLTLPEMNAGISQGIWWWDSRKILDSDVDKMLDTLAANHITEIYIDVSGMVEYDQAGRVSYRQMRGFVRKCSTLGIRVAAMTSGGGDEIPYWTDPKYSYTAMKNFVRNIRNYQKTAWDQEKFYGVHFDVEPQSYSGNGQDWVQRMAELIIATRNECDEKIPGLLLEWDIWEWFNGSNTVTGRDGRSMSMIELLSTECDTLVVMGYSNSPEIQIIKMSDELAVSRNTGCKVVAASEFSRIEENASYYYTSLEYAVEAMGELNRRLAGTGYKNVGSAIHFTDTFFEFMWAQYSPFNITADITGSGLISIASEEAAGETVMVSVSPAQGYTLTGGMLYYSYSGKKYPLYKNAGGDNTFSFVMPSGDVVVYADFISENAASPQAAAENFIGIFGKSTHLYDDSISFGGRALRTIKISGKTYTLEKFGMIITESEDGFFDTLGAQYDWGAMVAENPEKYSLLPCTAVIGRSALYVDYTAQLKDISETQEYAAVMFTDYKSGSDIVRLYSRPERAGLIQ